MTFAQRLRKLRKESGLTQTEFADKMGISRSSESMYETGGREPSFELVDTMAMFFDVDMNYLLGHSDVRSSYGGHQEREDAEIEKYLSSDQYALIMAYRSAPKEVQQAALRMLGVK